MQFFNVIDATTGEIVFQNISRDEADFRSNDYQGATGVNCHVVAVGNNYKNSSYMAYNNRGNNYQGGNSSRGNYSRGFQGSYNGSNSYSSNNNYQGRNNNQPKKHSGCTTGMSKKGKPYVRGWKYDKSHGMRSFIASEAKNSKVVTSKSGVKWMNVTVKVSHNQGITLYNAMLQVDTDKVFIQDLGLMMNPKAPNGGYTGPYYRRN